MALIRISNCVAQNIRVLFKQNILIVRQLNREILSSLPHPLTTPLSHMTHLHGSYTPAFLYTSEAIGTVELTGLDIIPNIAWGQLL